MTTATAETSKNGASTTHESSECLEAFLLTHPLSRAVEETSALLKRWYILERGTMRALAGWLPAVATQEIKLLMARHQWLDAVAADQLRERILELRYPRRDVDRKWEVSLTGLLEAAINAPDELCFVSGLYKTLKTSLLEAYKEAVAQSEPVGDEPTIFLLQNLLHNKEVQLQEMLVLLAEAEARNPAGADVRARWAEYLDARLQAMGGVSGNAQAAKTETPDNGLERVFQRPTKAQRDPRYERHCELMTHHPVAWVPDDDGVAWLSHAVSHFNEMWAAEAAAELLYNHSDAPWPLLKDAARWSYDEARHCQMGIARLQRAGFDIYKDLPAPDSITYDCFEPDHLQERLLAIHCFERGGVVGGGKVAALKWHQARGDGEATQHYDFDWADESIHLQYGLEWLKHLYGEEVLDSKFEERQVQAVEHRYGFFKELLAREEPLMEQYYRDLCDKLSVEFKVKPAENYIGRE